MNKSIGAWPTVLYASLAVTLGTALVGSMAISNLTFGYLIWQQVALFLLCGAATALFWIATVRTYRTKSKTPIVQYDAPQEGVCPPPPTVPGDTTRDKV